ncbi:unnamed protein product [Microthlaspi erraticum]|uniref:F-box/LRR-repeat protein 15/At3g58940/PEG3-like LRR domain-containing protein n=1 Tax=Microthlaspi erraticum TaxID=1685480 RepID=A0A6D2K502_9BRAS|nr:unnamed protein product [Microthlaspi erraticum]
MCRRAVDLSQGGLLEIKIEGFGCDFLLAYIADSGLSYELDKLPLLEELEISHSWFKLNLKGIGRSCPRVKTLKLNFCTGYRRSPVKWDIDAVKIANSMPQLRRLQLFGNQLTEYGLNIILDSCPHLEHLDLRKCFNVELVGDLEKRCLERIKDLRRPHDSTTDDYPF